MAYNANKKTRIKDLKTLALKINTDMQSIHGKSAFQIACDKGFTGTESEWITSLKGDSAYEVAVQNGYSGTIQEWLESLKAAGEWDTLDERTEILTYNSGALRNCIYRGKNLGTEVTAEQISEIKAGTFRDLWVGDYWEMGGYRWRIGGFNTQRCDIESGQMMDRNTLKGPAPSITALSSRAAGMDSM